MDKRIAKASKVPFVISSICLGRDTVYGLCGCFVWHTGGHKNQEYASIRELLIAIGPSIAFAFLHMLAYTWSTVEEGIGAFHD